MRKEIDQAQTQAERAEGPTADMQLKLETL